MKDYQHQLILAYNRGALNRDQADLPDWKIQARKDFLSTLLQENKSSLVDIGAGTGIHGKFFQDQGLDVTCVDLSPAHVELCKNKGLRSFELNILNTDEFIEKFESALALSSLLHIPTNDLPRALANIASLLEPDGLFYWSQFGGEHREGVYQDDIYQPKRFFNLLDDEMMINLAEKEFMIEKFGTIHHQSLEPLHFQTLLLRVIK